MADNGQPSLDLAELRRVLAAADPAALLVQPRILRRIIKQDRRLKGIGLQVPHRKTYVVHREALFQIVDCDELEIEPNRQLPASVILINEPEIGKLADLDREQNLVKYWRQLFHSRIHLAL